MALLVQGPDGRPRLQPDIQLPHPCSDRLAELERQVEQLGAQVAHVLHEIVNLRQGKDYGERE
jgi:hypothetical protein